MGTNASSKKIAWKVLAAFLAVLMMVAALPAAAFAANGDEYDIVITAIDKVITDGMNDSNGINPASDAYYEGEAIDYTGMKVEYRYVLASDFDFRKNEAKIAEASWSSDTMDFGNKSFEYLFSVSPANKSALQMSDNGRGVVVASKRDAKIKASSSAKTAGNRYDGKIAVKRQNPLVAKLINQFDDITDTSILTGDNESYVIVIDGYALAHKVTDGKVTITAKETVEVPACLKGSAVVIKKDIISNFDKDILWNVKVDDAVNHVYRFYFIDEDGIYHWLQLDGEKKIGDYYGGKAVATAYAEEGGDYASPVGSSFGADLWTVKVSSAQNNFAELYMYTVDTGSKYVYKLSYDKKNNCFFGEFVFDGNNGVLYLTDDIVENEGDTGIYKVGEIGIKSFEIIRDPFKMVYTEGENFDPTGLRVRVYYEDGSFYDVDYDADIETALGTTPGLNAKMTLDYNNQSVRVTCSTVPGGFQYTSSKLVVTAKEKVTYQLANEIESGCQYVIVAAADASTVLSQVAFSVPNNSKYGYALSSKAVNSIFNKELADKFVQKDLTALDASTLTARPVAWNQNVIVTDIDNDQIWTIVDNGSAKDGYSIIAGNGKYLSRVTNENMNLFMTTGLAANSNLSKWNIPGVNMTKITSNGTNNADDYKLFVLNDNDSDDPTEAFDFEVIAGHKNAFTADDKIGVSANGENYDADALVDFVLFKVIREVGNVKSIAIKQQPAKLVYDENDALNLNGMIVELTYNDGSVVVVPFNKFAAYNITVSGLAQDQKVALADDGKKVTVTCQGLTADTDAITVVGADDNGYPLATELKDGQYIIVWSNNYVKGVNTKSAYTRALSSKAANISNSSEVFSDLNDRLGSLGAVDVTVENDKVVSKVTDDMLWTVKAVKDKNGKVDYYTIQNNEGKYLEIFGLINDKANTYYDEAGNELTTTDEVKALKRDVLTLVDELTLDKDKDIIWKNNWQITGTKDADIYAFVSEDFEKKTDEELQKLGTNVYENYYLTFNTAAPVQNFFYADSTDYGYLNSISLYTIAKPHTLSSIVIKTEPAAELLKANEGDKFTSYGDLTVTVTYKDGVVEDVKAADFAAKGITVDYKVGDVLTRNDNGKAITVSLDGKSASTETKFEITYSDLAAKRLAGDDRIATAIEIAKAGWETSEFVIIANGYNYADALVGVSLAKAKDAPILLTKTEALDARVADEIKALGAKKAIILGGEAAISANVADALVAAGVSVARLGGATRYETAILIANEVNSNPSEVFFVTGKDGSYPDALSISSVAAIKNAPVLYVGTGDDVNAAVVNYINSKKTGLASSCIIGGTAAVSENIQAKLTALGCTVERVDGADRYETSLNVAKKYASIFTSKDVAVATGSNYPDALAGGAFAAKKGCPVILVEDGATNANVKALVAANYASNLYVFGGTAVVSDATVDAILGK